MTRPTGASPRSTRPATTGSAARRFFALLASGAGTAGASAVAFRWIARSADRPASWRSLPNWLVHSPPDRIALHLIVVLAAAAAVYLAALYALAAAGRLARSARTVQLADRLSGGLIGRLCLGAITASLGGGLVGAVPAAAAPPSDVTVATNAVTGYASDPGATEPTMIALGAGVGRVEASVPAGAEWPKPQMHRVEGPTGAVEPVSTTPEPDPPEPTMRVMQAEPTGAWRPIWIVRSGDNLWDIAEAVLRDRGNPAPTTAEIHQYWQTLIIANQHNLVDPADPDLLFSGQQLSLPG